MGHMSAQPPQVTIVISSYNQSEYLLEAIASAQRQTVACRVMVADDGSTDGSVELARSCGVDVESYPHRGAFETFRSGIDAVETPFFILLGGDDRLHVEYVEKTIPPMESSDVGFVYTGMRWFGAEDRTVSAGPYSVSELLWNNYVHASSLTRLSAYRDVGGLDATFSRGAEDWGLWVAMVAAGWTGACVDEPLLEYRRHPAGSRSASRSYWHGQRIRMALVRRHPGMYLRHAPSLLRIASRQLRRRLSGRPSSWR